MLDNQWFSTEISPMQNLVFGSLILIADPFGDRLLWVPVYELLFKPDSLVITKAIDLFKTRKIFMFVVYIKKDYIILMNIILCIFSHLEIIAISILIFTEIVYKKSDCIIHFMVHSEKKYYQ